MSIRPLTALPTYIAFFEVYVPITDDNYSQESAVAKIERYLYAAFTIKGEARLVSLVGDDSHWAVVVQATDYFKSDRIRGAVQDQRDRLSSGLYASSEPTFYAPTGV
jgi:hypothetical protein